MPFTPCPQLRHNITLLVDLAEADLKRLDARLRHQKDTMEVLARERERLGGEVEEVRGGWGVCNDE